MKKKIQGNRGEIQHLQLILVVLEMAEVNIMNARVTPLRVRWNPIIDA